MTEHYKQWAYTACHLLCHTQGDCKFCMKTFKMNDCPKEYAFKRNYDETVESTIRWVKFITDEIYTLEEDKLPFNISLDELIEILETEDDSK